MEVQKRRKRKRSRRKQIQRQRRALCIGFLLIAAIILLFSLRRCSPDEDVGETYLPPVDDGISNAGTIMPPVREEEKISAEIQTLLTKAEISDEEQHKLMGYTHRTAEGIRFYKRATDQGYLEFTISNVRYLGNGDEWPQRNYLHEAYLELNEDNNWVEHDRPVCLNPDGTSKTGWNLVLVDVKVTSHNAAARLGDYSNKNPYLFRGDGVCTLANLNLKYEGNYLVRNIDYFSELGKYPEHYVLYRLEPGETISFTIGFLQNSKQQNGVDPNNLRLCNTTGNLHGAFIRLDEEGLGKCD